MEDVELKRVFNALVKSKKDHLTAIKYLLQLALYGIESYCTMVGTNRNNDVIAPLIKKAITATENISRK